MRVDKIATMPPPTVQADATVKEAIPSMNSKCGCGVAVMDGAAFVGTLSRDDVMMRVVGEGLDVATTKVRDVMHPPVETVRGDTKARDALKKMYAQGRCYLGVVDDQGTLTGWLAICNLFQEREDDLSQQMDSIVSYLAADNPGG
jgi:predicted transcriptional regulator